jgi:hypothetical protein
MRTDVLVEASMDGQVHAVDRSRSSQGFVAAAPHHREDLAEGALEAAVGVVARPRVMRDRLRHLREGDLEKSGAPSAEEHAGMAVDTPQRRLRAEHSGYRIGRLGGETREARLEIR